MINLYGTFNGNGDSIAPLIKDIDCVNTFTAVNVPNPVSNLQMVNK
jgi:hypothetical protein